jgi:capsular polysaccharide biosynthesis protein
MLSRFHDWYRRLRARQLVKTGRVAVIAAAQDCEVTLRGTVDPDFPVHVLRGGFIGDFPAIMSRTLKLPYGIVEESVDYHEQHSKRSMTRHFLRGDLRAAHARPLEDVMCLAVNRSHNNYYHWLIDTLPKALLAEDVGFTGIYLVPPQPYARQSLELLGISGDRIVEHHSNDLWKAERLFVSTPFDYDLQFRSPKLLAHLRAALLAALPKPHGRRRLYISRNRPGVSRDIVNEAELKALLGRFGFTEYFNEDHSIAAQLADFAAAEAVIGSEGSNFANVLTMPEGALLVALGSPLRFNSIGTLVPVRISRLRYYLAIPNTSLHGINYPHGDRVEAYLEFIESTLERELA